MSFIKENGNALHSINLSQRHLPFPSSKVILTSRKRPIRIEDQSQLSFWQSEPDSVAAPETETIEEQVENIQVASASDTNVTDVATQDVQIVTADASSAASVSSATTTTTATTASATSTTVVAAQPVAIAGAASSVATYGVVLGSVAAGVVGVAAVADKVAEKVAPAIAEKYIEVFGVILEDIFNAMVYVDANNNGTADLAENINAIVDAAGHFSCSTNLVGNLIVVGMLANGIGQNEKIVLKAPKGAEVINTMTTLLSDTMTLNPTWSQSQAESALLNGLGLQLPTGVSLTNYNIKSALALNASDPAAIAFQQKSVQLIEIASSAAKAGAAEAASNVTGVTTAFANQTSNVFAKLAQNISASSTAVNLEDSTVIGKVLTDSGVTSQIAADAKQTIASVVTSIGNAQTAADMYLNAITIATQLPTVSASLLLDTGASGSDRITMVGTLNPIAPHYDLNTNSLATVQYSIDSGTTWSSVFNAAEGVNTLQVRQTVGGNSSTPTTFTFTLDTTINSAPTISLAHDNGVVGDLTTNDATIAGVEAGATIKYWTPQTITNILGTYTIWNGPYNSYTPVQGLNRIKITQWQDVAGNVGNPLSQSNELAFTYDSIAPIATLANFSNLDVQTGSVPIVVNTASLFTGANSITLSTTSATAPFTLNVDSLNQSLVSITAGTTAGNSWITATATDSAGNVSTHDFAVAVYSGIGVVNASASTAINAANFLYQGTAGTEIFDLSGVNTNAVIKGDLGSDIFVLNSATLDFAQLVGGSDAVADVLRLSANSNNLDLSQYNHVGQKVLSNIEVIDCATDVGNNSFTLTAADLFLMGSALTDGTAMLFRIDGGANDTINLAGSGMSLAGTNNAFDSAGITGTGYSKYTGSYTESSGTHLVEILIQSGMQIV